MTSKMVALCLLRLLPRGGSKFRLWLQRKVCRIEFERQTRKLRAWRVFMMRPLETREEGVRRIDPFMLGLPAEIATRVEIALENAPVGAFEMVHIYRKGTYWARWRILY